MQSWRGRLLTLGAALTVFLIGVVIGRVSAPDNRASGVQGTVLFGGCGASPCHFVPQAACQVVRKDVKGYYDERAEAVARFCSEKDGKYRVSVPPGKYYIEPDNTEQRGLLKPSGPIDVQPGGFTSWNLAYDNGWR